MGPPRTEDMQGSLSLSLLIGTLGLQDMQGLLLLSSYLVHSGCGLSGPLTLSLDWSTQDSNRLWLPGLLMGQREAKARPQGGEGTQRPGWRNSRAGIETRTQQGEVTRQETRPSGWSGQGEPLGCRGSFRDSECPATAGRGARVSQLPVWRPHRGTETRRRSPRCLRRLTTHRLPLQDRETGGRAAATGQAGSVLQPRHQVRDALHIVMGH